MKKQFHTEAIKKYVRLNWFKLSLLAMLIFVFLRKDLSFQFQLNSPSSTPTEEMRPSEVEQVPIEKKKKEQLTQQKNKAQKAPKSQTFLSAVELPMFSLSQTKEPAAVELPTADKTTRQHYIKRFGQVAVSESKKYAIPASIILANAILHSSYGQRNLSRFGNNHFGIPCTTDWQGESNTYSDACYRHYENAWTSFRDHSLYVTSGRFASLRQLSSGDYKAWAKALEKLSFSDVYDDLATRMIELIEKEELYGYDMR